MAGRVAGKVAIVVGAGQMPGQGVGNGRAAALLLAREGARVVAADRDLASAQETSIRSSPVAATPWRSRSTSPARATSAR